MKVIYTFDGSFESGALWQNTLDGAFMQVHIANYQIEPDGWTFTGTGAQPQHIRSREVKVACAEFLRRMGLIVEEKQIMLESERPDLTKSDQPYRSPFPKSA